MKINIFSKLSNRTKIIAGGAALFATAAIVSSVVDRREVKEIENDYSDDVAIGESVIDAIEELGSTNETLKF